jgi:hypothetical protein
MAADQLKPALNWAIYVLKNPRTQEVRYVGWTKRSINARMRDHISHARRKHGTHRDRWILSLLSIGLDPLVEVLESGEGAGWADAERRWIAFYRASGARLVNATDGGEGVAGWGTAKQRSERARRGRARLTPKQLSAIAATANRGTHEELSARSRQGQLGRTPEARKESARKRLITLTPERRAEYVKKGHASRTPEERSAWGKAANAAQTFEMRSAASKMKAAAKTPEQRSEISRKGALTLRASRLKYNS